MAKRKERPLLEKVADDGNCKFARALGSVDYHTREKGLQALTLWLSRKHGVGELQIARIWKGIFYCFWHSDKQPVQAALAEQLSEMILQLPEQVSLLYYIVFIKTLRREWFGIDHLRLDKFLMLIRKFFHQVLRLLQAADWAADRVHLYADLWLNEVLLPHDNRVAAGLGYHLCDVLLPELAAVCSSGGGSQPQQPTLLALLEPFCQALARTCDPALLYRLRQGVFEPLVKQLASPNSPCWHPLDTAALATHLFDLGAQQETRAKNREALYAISTALEKAGKQQQQQRRQAAAARSQRANKPMPKLASGTADAQPPPPPQQQQQQHAGKKAKAKKRSAEEAGGATPWPSVPGTQQAGRQSALAVAPAAEHESGATHATAGQPKKAAAKRARVSVRRAAAQQQQQPSSPHQPEHQQQQLISAKKRRVAAAQLNSGTPLTAGPAAAGQGDGGGTTGGKKNVRFSLRRNLVMTIGQPPLPEDVRTPPTAKPKGPALKAVSSLKAPPGSAPGRLNQARQQGARRKLGQQQGAGGSSRRASKGAGASGTWQQRDGGGARRVLSLVSPHSLPRSKASEFF